MYIANATVSQSEPRQYIDIGGHLKQPTGYGCKRVPATC